MKTNENRKIKIYRTNDNQKTWKTNLSQIISAQTQREGTSLFNISSSDVSTEIDLLMTEAPKSPMTSNGYSTPVKSVTRSLNQGKISGVLSSIASYGINIVSAYNDVFVENVQQTGRTAQIFQPWSTNVRAWSGDTSEGIGFTYDFKFSMGQYGLWNAKEEVIKPILNLVAPAFPQYLSDLGMAGPFPSSTELLMRLFTGDSLDKITQEFTNTWGELKGAWTTTDNDGKESMSSNIGDKTNSISKKVMESLDSIASALTSIVATSYNNLTFTVEFGNVIKFDNMLITDASTNFSNEVDQFGYPTSGTAKLTFRGIIPLALKTDINNAFGETQMFPKEQ